MFGALARHYDALMRHVNYDLWADYVGGLLYRAKTPLETILDLGCGTGSLTHMLARRGFDVIGVDSSPDMLAAASAKSHEDPRSPDGAENPMFLCQQLWELDLYGTVDAAVSTLDTFNYITRPEQLQSVFDRTHTFLNPGGMLVFDMRTPAFYAQTDGQSFTSETPDCFCAWTMDYSARLETCDMQIDLFERDGQLWRRHRETHRQRCYELEHVEACLRRSGFDQIRALRPFENTPPERDDDRVFFSALKQV